MTNTIQKTTATMITSGPGKIEYPLPPKNKDEKFEMEVYARFMSYLREVPNSKEEIKILSAIQFTSDVMDTSDALVSKTLLDLGLRAPRKAFPGTFLEFVDHTMARSTWETGSPPSSVIALSDYWAQSGEDVFEAFIRPYYALSPETVYEPA